MKGKAVPSCENYGLSNQLIFTGFLNDSDLYRNFYNLCSKIFVFPSIHGRVWPAATEAMRCGTAYAGFKCDQLAPRSLVWKRLYLIPLMSPTFAVLSQRALTDSEFYSALPLRRRLQIHWDHTAQPALGRESL